MPNPGKKSQVWLHFEEEENSAKCILSRYKDFFFDATQAERIRRAVLREGLRLSLNEENEDSDPETPSKRSRLYNEGENVDSQTHKLFWACFEKSAIEQPEPTEKQSKNATAQEIAKYTALAKADRKINPYEWWALSTNKNGFPILSKLAKRYLITPASSVYSERLFTEAGLLYEKKRNRLAPERAEKIVFLHLNLPLVDFKY
ncbi:Zinc finger BED domain-containing protein 4 [Eumeta japonica]|uniref:Zinc finger BED domain-containing protein 4 n=1 Tax=Eumeta variegata TaxID=151549 RepID=A0A4C1V4C7_EUMVA|nr:Zinc finger BED domain-containing protein 4 [Eumeta japonica]